MVTGGSGFVGQRLVPSLIDKGARVTVLGRRVPDDRIDRRADVRRWTPEQPGDWYSAVDGSDAVVHLAGEPVIGKRWSDEQKGVIVRSRVDSTRQLVAAMRAAKKRPSVFVCASAVGYYGNHPASDPVDESRGPGQGFLASVVRDWEAAADEASELGGRVVKLRIGLVLGHGGGPLGPMLPAFKMFVGGPVGPGDQMMPWVHIDDIVGLIELGLTRDDAKGPINATAPNPVSMNEFARSLGKALHRPAVFPVPTPVVRLLLGEAADAVVEGQAVLPRAAEALGYSFRYTKLDSALADLFGRAS